MYDSVSVISNVKNLLTFVPFGKMNAVVWHEEKAYRYENASLFTPVRNLTIDRSAIRFIPVYDILSMFTSVPITIIHDKSYDPYIRLWTRGSRIREIEVNAVPDKLPEDVVSMLNAAFSHTLAVITITKNKPTIGIGDLTKTSYSNGTLVALDKLPALPPGIVYNIAIGPLREVGIGVGGSIKPTQKRTPIPINIRKLPLRGVGTLPGEMEERIRALRMFHSRERVRIALRRAIGEELELSWTEYTREQVLHGVHRPSWVPVMKFIGDVIIAVDVSGSITQRAASGFLAVAYEVLKSYAPYNIRCHIMAFDVNVQDYKQVPVRKLPEVVIKYTGGGTDHYAPINFITNRRLRFPPKTPIIYLSDGFVPRMVTRAVFNRLGLVPYFFICNHGQYIQFKKYYRENVYFLERVTE